MSAAKLWACRAATAGIAVAYAIVALACAAALTACGGGGSEETPAPEATKALPRIQLFGDSTMYTAAPYWIERWGSHIENRARSGTGSTALIHGTDKLNAPWPMSVSAPYYVVNHGLNDGYVGLKSFIGLDQYRENLRTLAKAPGATAIFMTPVPSTRPGRDMAPYANVMREVAAEHGLRVIDVYVCFQTQPEWKARIPDMTHPDADGLRFIVNQCAAPVIESLRGL